MSAANVEYDILWTITVSRGLEAPIERNNLRLNEIYIKKMATIRTKYAKWTTKRGYSLASASARSRNLLRMNCLRIPRCLTGTLQTRGELSTSSIAEAWRGNSQCEGHTPCEWPKVLLPARAVDSSQEAISQYQPRLLRCKRAGRGQWSFGPKDLLCECSCDDVVSVDFVDEAVLGVFEAHEATSQGRRRR